MSDLGGRHDSSLNTVFLDALQTTVDDYKTGRFRPLSESDIQAHLYSQCIHLLRDRLEVLPVHTETKLPALEWARKKIDLTLGDEVAVELKFEPVYPGVRTPVAESREALADINRLQLLIGLGFKHCHLIFIDEHGMHARNRNRLYENTTAKWTSIQSPRGPAYFFHWTVQG